MNLSLVLSLTLSSKNLEYDSSRNLVEHARRGRSSSSSGCGGGGRRPFVDGAAVVREGNAGHGGGVEVLRKGGG